MKRLERVLVYLYQKCHFYDKIVEVSKNEANDTSCHCRRANVDSKLRMSIDVLDTRVVHKGIEDVLYLKYFNAFCINVSDLVKNVERLRGFIPPSSSSLGNSSLDSLDQPNTLSFLRSALQSKNPARLPRECIKRRVFGQAKDPKTVILVVSYILTFEIHGMSLNVEFLNESSPLTNRSNKGVSFNGAVNI